MTVFIYFIWSEIIDCKIYLYGTLLLPKYVLYEAHISFDMVQALRQLRRSTRVLFDYNHSMNVG